MIHINLLPTKDTEKALGQRNLRSLILLAATLMVLVMVVPWVIQGHRIGMLERETHVIKLQIERYNEQVKEVENLEKQKGELEAKLQVIADLNEKRVGPARVLADLSLATPDKLWVSEFRESGSSATFTGFALDNETIAEFMRALDGSGYFLKVDLVETAESRDLDVPGFKRFIVNATIDYFGRDGGRPEGTVPPDAEEGGKATKGQPQQGKKE